MSDAVIEPRYYTDDGYFIYDRHLSEPIAEVAQSQQGYELVKRLNAQPVVVGVDVANEPRPDETPMRSLVYELACALGAMKNGSDGWKRAWACMDRLVKYVADSRAVADKQYAEPLVTAGYEALEAGLATLDQTRSDEVRKADAARFLDALAQLETALSIMPNGWSEIDSAPRDGTEFLAAKAFGDGDWMAWVVRRNRAGDAWVTTDGGGTVLGLTHWKRVTPWPEAVN